MRPELIQLIRDQLHKEYEKNSAYENDPYTFIDNVINKMSNIELLQRIEDALSQYNLV